MLPTYDTSSKAISGSGVTSLTWAHTCSGSNRLLVVGVIMDASSPAISSVTYGGVALTHVSTNEISSLFGSKVALYYLAAPATGSNNIVITIAVGYKIWGVASSYNGIRQSSPLDTSVQDSESSIVNSYSASITTASANELLVWVMGCQIENSTLTGTSGTTKRQDQTGGGSGVSAHILDEFATASGSNTVDATNSQNSRSGSVLAAFKPAISAVLTAEHGTYALTGNDSIIRKIFTLIASAGMYTLTGKPIQVVINKWRNVAKNVSSWINLNKS